jgi:hypothetical protein
MSRSYPRIFRAHEDGDFRSRPSAKTARAHLQAQYTDDTALQYRGDTAAGCGVPGCTVVVLSMSKQEFNRHRHGNRVGSQRPATRSAIFQPPLPLKLSVSTVSQSLDCGTVMRDESCLPHFSEITRL